jgi:hypothetical protein
MIRHKLLLKERNVLIYVLLRKTVGSVRYFVKHVMRGAAGMMEISTYCDEAQHYKKEQQVHVFYGFVVIQVRPRLLICELRMILTHASNAANPDRAPGNIPLGLPIPPRADGPPDFGLLRAWLGWCDDNHKCNKHQPERDTTLPTRLLYVGVVDDPSYDSKILRLELGSQIQAVKYIALSHRWGELAVEEKRSSVQPRTTSTND